MKNFIIFTLCLGIIIGILTGCDDQVSNKTFGGPAFVQYRIVVVDGKYYLASRSYGNAYIVGPEVKTSNPDVKFVPENP